MPQPSGQYVILHHTGFGDEHWDLMLERGQLLATWQLLENPQPLLTGDATGSIPARRIGDHRRAYLTYEGPVSNDRGEVARIAAGRYETVEDTADEWRFRMGGGVFSVGWIGDGRFQRLA